MLRAELHLLLPPRTYYDINCDAFSRVQNNSERDMGFNSACTPGRLLSRPLAWATPFLWPVIIDLPCSHVTSQRLARGAAADTEPCLETE